MNEVTENVRFVFLFHTDVEFSRWKNNCFYTRSSIFRVTGDAYADGTVPDPDRKLSVCFAFVKV
jgi:hypothetical protein